MFGWIDVTYPPGDLSALILLAYSPRQFVFLLADDTPMQCPRMNHFGLEVATQQVPPSFFMQKLIAWRHS